MIGRVDNEAASKNVEQQCQTYEIQFKFGASKLYQIEIDGQGCGSVSIDCHYFFEWKRLL